MDDELDAAYADSPDTGPEGPEPALFAGVAVSWARPVEDVVAVLRDGVEQVALGTLGIDLTWTTVAITSADDLESGRTDDTSRPGLDWDFVLGRGDGLRSVSVVAEATAMLAHPWHPKRTVAVVHASLPQAGRREGGLTAAVSVHRWAMYGGGEDLGRPVGLAGGWLLGAAERLQAQTGFLTLDRVSADALESPWERVSGLPPALRDVSTHLWGHGWGTLLSPVHLERVGGAAALEASGLGDVHELSGGRVWFTLRRDLAEVTHDDVAALRQVLLPALPPARRTPDQFRREIEEYGVAEPDYLV